MLQKTPSQHTNLWSFRKQSEEKSKEANEIYAYISYCKFPTQVITEVCSVWISFDPINLYYLKLKCLKSHGQV
jgi:hypothetical protein